MCIPHYGPLMTGHMGTSGLLVGNGTHKVKHLHLSHGEPGWKQSQLKSNGWFDKCICWTDNGDVQL